MRLNLARSRTYNGPGYSREQGGESGKSSEKTRTPTHKSKLNNKTNENNINHIRKNLLIKSENLLKKIYGIASIYSVQKVPKFSSFEKKQKKIYFKEYEISSENDFIKHIFQLCKDYLEKIQELNKNGNNIKFKNINDTLKSLNEYKTYINLNENDNVYGLYKYVLYVLNKLQNLEDLYSQLT